MLLRPGDRIGARFYRPLASRTDQLTPKRRRAEATSRPFRSFSLQMKSGRHLSAAADFGASNLDQHDLALDRKIIRVDIPPAHAGITAALRRAFAPVAGAPCDRDFHDLLRKLS